MESELERDNRGVINLVRKNKDFFRDLGLF